MQDAGRARHGDHHDLVRAAGDPRDERPHRRDACGDHRGDDAARARRTPTVSWRLRSDTDERETGQGDKGRYKVKGKSACGPSEATE